MLDALRARNFDIGFHHHAGSLVAGDFPGLEDDLVHCLAEMELKISSLIGGGGGEAEGTQALRRKLVDRGWTKRTIQIEKTVVEFVGTPGKRTFQETDRIKVASLSHEIDHVKRFESGVALLEIEWNNKDPFFDRDLENFKRLHADGAASLGIIVTRGASFQNEIQERIVAFARERQLSTIEALERFGLDPTRRQRTMINDAVSSASGDFPAGWAKAFVSDKYGSATTHWAKLEDRLRRGVGNPCPLIAIGIPIDCVVDA
ncbi:MAG: hypothetical protein JJU18_01305 [Oceanicaulis sp.]|nr:hypothetical protein [Oceanicaulis sp.]